MDTHIFTDGFEIWPDQTLDCGVSCPRASVKSPKTDKGRNIVTTLVLSILYGSASFLQTRRKTIKALMSLNFVKIPSPVMELVS